MKRIVTPAEMQEIDRKTIQEFAIPGETLMENAGKAVFEAIRSKFPGFKNMRIAVFCGKGNNGGDGLVVTRLLKMSGAMPRVFILGSIQNLRTDSLVQFNKMIAAGIQPEFIDEERYEKDDERPDLVIDALLGTGARGDLRGALYQIVRTINEWRTEGSHVLAIDVPSGLNGETGRPENMVVRAHATVTMGLPKTGLLFGDGKNYTGDLIVADLGFPAELTRGGDVQLIEAIDVRERLTERRHDAHKHMFGKVLIIGGSRGMTGAVALAARAAMRGGAGLVRVAAPPPVTDVVRVTVPEVMTADLDATPAGSIARSAMPKLAEQLEWSSVVAMGCGLSQNDETMAMVKEFVRTLNKPAVIDADAIIALAGEFELIQNIQTDVLFTPHAGEFAMLSGTIKEKLLADRPAYTRAAAKKLQKPILLKGSPTLVADPSGAIFVNPNGNPGMATGGSGDVLTGLIAALLGQGLMTVDAGFVGAYLHGLAGDLAAAEKSERGLTAGDLIDYLPRAFLQSGVK
jgi:NAD(P)H-hydrate epimerase